MEPIERGLRAWDGNVVIDERGRPVPVPDPTNGSMMTYVAEGIMDALSNSPCSSLPMTHLYIQVGNLKTLASKVPAIVIGATSATLRRRIRDAGMGPLLEPFVFLKISVSESSLGKVIKDLTERGGEVLDLDDGVSSQEDKEGYSEEGIYVPPEWLSPSATPSSLARSSGSHIRRSIQAVAPLSQFMDYSNRLRSISEGHGVFEMSSAGFKEVSEERKLEILKEIGRA
jgi:elongation factor G